MKVLCIIPARGGSKGVPRKNIRLLAGKPLIVYSIEHAIEARCIDRVVVSTDDKEIAEISQEHGAEVIKRPKEISGDKDSSESALLHVLTYLKNNEGYDPDLVVFLQATSVIRNPGDIDRAFDMLVKSKADSCFSAYAEHFMARWSIGESGAAIPLNMELSKRPLRQDVPTQYLENGNIYVLKPWVLYETGDRLGGKIVICPMNLLDSLQIDTLEDIELVEQLLTIKKSEHTSIKTQQSGDQPV